MFASKCLNIYLHLHDITSNVRIKLTEVNINKAENIFPIFIFLKKLLCSYFPFKYEVQVYTYFWSMTEINFFRVTKFIWHQMDYVYGYSLFLPNIALMVPHLCWSKIYMFTCLIQEFLYIHFSSVNSLMGEPTYKSDVNIESLPAAIQGAYPDR